MLDNNVHGFAVMSKDLSACSFDDISLEICKRYCRNDYVIVERIPYVSGFSIRVMWHEFYKPFYFKYYCNILWLHWSTSKEYLHKNGKIVYRNERQNN